MSRIRLAIATALTVLGSLAVVTAAPTEAATTSYRWGGPNVQISPHTSRAWDVNGAANEWNRPSDLKVSLTQRCPKDYTRGQCISIEQADLGRGNLIAQAQAYTVYGNKHRTARCVVTVNTRQAHRSAAVKRSALLHEIGHCMGLAHTGRTDSVMTSSARHFPTRLTAFDLREVERQYPW